MKWKMNKNINNPPAADAAAIELPEAGTTLESFYTTTYDKLNIKNIT
jgi:hypothetical protein